MHLLILAHIITDFIFQTKKIITLKNEFKWYGFLIHYVICFLSTIIVLLFKIEIKEVIIIGLIIASTHILIDYFKIIAIKLNKNYKALLFICDQVFHIFVIYKVDLLFSLSSFQTSDILLAFVSILFVMLVGDYFVRSIVQYKKQETYSEDDFGQIIGYCERVIIYISLINNFFEIIVAIVAIKSIVRYAPTCSDQNKNDYYILGNLASMLFVLSYYYIFFMLMGIDF